MPETLSPEQQQEARKLLMRQQIEQHLGGEGQTIEWGIGNSEVPAERVGGLLKLMSELPEGERGLFADELKRGLEESNKRYIQRLVSSKESEDMKGSWRSAAYRNHTTLNAVIKGFQGER